MGVTVSITAPLPPAGTFTEEELSVELELGDDANETVPLNPLTDVTVIVEEPELPEFSVKDDGFAEMVKSGIGGCRYGMRLFVNGLPTPVTKS